MAPPDHPPPELLDAFAVGRVTDAELAAIAAHLAGCPTCCARLDHRGAADPVVARLRAASQGDTDGRPARAAAVRAIRDGLFAGRSGGVSTVAGRADETIPAALPSGAAVHPERVGVYEIAEEVGRGGMGVVYRAWHPGLNRAAAVKVVLAGRLAGESDRLRLRLEAELAARVRHPNVVQVYDVGEYDGSPYLAMEWVAGGTLADRLDGRPWPPTDAARLVLTLAEAVQAAHDEGVVHRDLKPANILLAGDLEARGTKSEQEVRPGSDSNFPLGILNFQPKVGDFGLARAADGPGLTRSGVVAGTPEYMAPEQAAGGRAAVGPGADVYALGGILFRLLTGRTPFPGDDPIVVLAAVVNREPPRPRRLNPLVPRDLEAVCLKCLEKRPHRRYESARELAADLGRFRAGRAVTARRVGAAARLARWGRRNPGTAGLLGSLAAAIAVGFGLVTWKWREADGLREVAEDRRADAEGNAAAADARRREARRNLYIANVRLAKRAVDEAQLALARDLLDEAAAGQPGDDDLRGWEWDYLHRLARPPVRTVVRYPERIFRAVFSPDGRVAVAAGLNGSLWVTEVASGREAFALRRVAPVVRSLWVSPDGTRLAHTDGQHVQLRCAPDWAPAGRLDIGNRFFDAIAGRPDGGRVAVAGPTGDVQVWDAGSGERLAAFTPDGVRTQRLAYAPDGGRLAAAGRDGVLRIVDADTGAVLAKSAAAFASPNAVGPDPMWQVVAFGRDGRVAVVGGPDEAVRVVDAATGATRVIVPRAAPARPYALAVGPGGGVFVAACGDGTARVFDTATGLPRATLRGHAGPVCGVAVTTDGRVLTASHDGTVAEWEPGGAAESAVVGDAGAPVVAVAWSPDGRLAAGTQRGRVKVWGPGGGPPADLPGHTQLTHTVAFGPGGRLVTAGADHAARVWDPAGRSAAELAGHTGAPRWAAFGPGGGWLATAGFDQTVRIWDPTTGGLLRTIPAGVAPTSAALRPDGRHLAAVADDGRVRVWEVETGRPVATLETDGGKLEGVTYSPDGRRLAVAGTGGGEVWEADAGRRLFTLRGHPGGPRRVAYTPDGRRLVTAGWDDTIRVWDAAYGRELLALSAPGLIPVTLAVSPDGRQIAAGVGTTVRTWEAFPIPPDVLARRRLTD